MVIDIVHSSVSKLVGPYKKWITANPQLLADIESTVRCLSCFTAGHFNNSTFASELIYSMPNLIVLFNDLLIYSNKCVHLKLPHFESKIKIWLTVVEYTETLFEISAKKIWGERGRWIIITFIQLVKSILRLLLVHVYKERVTKNPSIPPLDREKLNEPQVVKVKEGFTLKRSGTVVRSIRTTNPTDMRTWEALPPNRSENDGCATMPATEKKLILAESLYITKPLLHLGCLSVTGEKRWPPWLLSLIVDLISLKIFKDAARAISFSKEDEKEFFRRRLSLLLYIIRSPFYDKYSCMWIHAALTVFQKRVPFARLLPITKCLPYWQSMYFYMWSC